MEKINHQIKIIRIKYNLSQDRFAKKLGISGKAISAYETGRSLPPLKVLESISNTYNVSFVGLPKEDQQKLSQKIEDIQNSLNELKNIIKEGLSL